MELKQQRGYRLWDRDNPAQQRAVTPRYKELLLKNVIIMTKILKIRNPRFSAYLRMYEVIPGIIQQELSSMISESGAIIRLINYLLTEEMWVLHAFFKVIVETKQGHILNALGLDQSDYIPEKEPDVPAEVVLLGDAYVEAYRKACRGGVKKVCKSRVMLVGHGGAGKTSLKNHLIDNELVIAKKGSSQPTNGIDIDSKVHVTKIKSWQHHKDNDEYVQSVAEYIVNVVDEEISKIRPEEDDIDASLMDSRIQKKVKEVIEDLQDTSRGRIPPEIELAVRKIMQERPGNKADDGLDIFLFFWDFGGQGVFYNTHKTFLTRRSIYIVVLDLMHKLDEPVVTLRHDRRRKQVPDTACPTTTADYLDYWCSCIHTFVEHKFSPKGAEEGQVCTPAIIIVCTHKDECTEELVQQYEDAIWEFVEEKAYRNQIHERVFMITNTDSDEDEVNALKQTIGSLAKDQTLYLPLSWVQFKERITQHSESPLPQSSQEPKRKRSEKAPRKTWNEAMEIGKGIGMTDVNIALGFFHELGDLLFFDEEPLRDFIITDPSWLIEEFSKVITIPQYRAVFPSSHRCWKLLDTAGLLHAAILEHVWSADVREELIHLMMKFSLLVPLTSKHTLAHALDNRYVCAELQKGLYLVPSLLPSIKQSISTVALCEDVDGGCEPPVILIPHEDFLPIGLTSRLIVGLINEDEWQLAGKVFQDFAPFFPKGERASAIMLCVRRKGTKIQITGKELQGRKAENDFSEGLRVVLDRLDKITSSVCPQPRFHLGIRCPDCHAKEMEAILHLEDRGRELGPTVFCKHHGDTCSTSLYNKWFRQTCLEATDTGDQDDVADGMMSAHELAATAAKVKKELHDEQVKLVSSAGIGVLVADTMFVARLRSLKIVNDYHIKGIEVTKHPADKVSMLIGCLQACNRAQIILFLWILNHMRYDHQLPKSITARVKRTLSKYTTVDQLRVLEKHIEQVR